LETMAQSISMGTRISLELELELDTSCNIAHY